MAARLWEACGPASYVVVAKLISRFDYGRVA